MKRFALFLAAAATFASSAFAAGVDSRVYSCGALQALIATNRFVFLNTPGFGDFVVVDRSFCSASDTIQRRTVATTDAAECPVYYCRPPSETPESGGM